MTFSAILFTLLSAVCHASWNLLSKSRGVDPTAFLRRALWYSMLLYAPLFFAAQFWIVYTPIYLLLALFSGICTGLFFFFLARAYQSGDVSFAYPVSRAFPILVVTWAGLFLGELPGCMALIGIVLIVAGCFFLPISSLRSDLTAGHFFNSCSGWALLSALVISIASVLDKYAAIRMPSDEGANGIITRVAYVYLQNTVSFAVMVLATRKMIAGGTPVRRSRAIAAGILFLISYSLIIFAFSRGKAGYIVSLRQLSIVLTTLLSMFFLEKKFSPFRLAGVLVITAGIMLVALER